MGKGPLHIQDMVRAEPLQSHSHLPFDARRDLTEKQKQTILRAIETGEPFTYHDRLPQWRNFALLWPHTDTSSPRRQLEIQEALKSHTSLPRYVADIKIIAPEALTNYDMESLWEKLTIINGSSQFDLLTHGIPVQYYEALKITRILFPTREVPLNKPLLEDFTSIARSDLTASYGFGPYLKHKADLRLISPEAFATLSFSEDFWRKTHAKLSNLKKEEDWVKVAQFAAECAIISAKEIINTPSEFRLIPPDPPFATQKRTSLPVLRDF